uniref:Uncharacterized protein n=1 Tax=Chelonoidis abingdonii TaxID=106734 RepID=A0A8C0HHF8_CHEAB
EFQMKMESLQQRQKELRDAMVEKQAQLQQYLEQSNNEIMQLNNQLAVLQAQQEQARAKVHQWVSGETVVLWHARGRGVGDC